MGLYYVTLKYFSLVIAPAIDERLNVSMGTLAKRKYFSIHLFLLLFVDCLGLRSVATGTEVLGEEKSTYKLCPKTGVNEACTAVI